VCNCGAFGASSQPSRAQVQNQGAFGASAQPPRAQVQNPGAFGASSQPPKPPVQNPVPRRSSQRQDLGAKSVSRRVNRRAECLRSPLYEVLDQHGRKVRPQPPRSVGDGGPQRACHTVPARRAHFSERRIQRAKQMLRATRNRGALARAVQNRQELKFKTQGAFGGSSQPPRLPVQLGVSAQFPAVKTSMRSPCRAVGLGARSVCAALCMKCSSSRAEKCARSRLEALGLGVPNALGTPTARGGRTFPSAESKGRSKCSARREIAALARAVHNRQN
jgi:hypothetical protein